MNNWYDKDVESVRAELKTDINNGLSNNEVLKRQEEQGFNELKQGKKKSIIVKFLEEFKDFMIIVLIIAAIISGLNSKLLPLFPFF